MTRKEYIADYVGFEEDVWSHPDLIDGQRGFYLTQTQRDAIGYRVRGSKWVRVGRCVLKYQNNRRLKYLVLKDWRRIEMIASVLFGDLEKLDDSVVEQIIEMVYRQLNLI